MNAATGTGRTLVLAPGTYRETVAVDASRTDMTWLGATGDPRDVVIVYDNAAGTQKPDGSGAYGTSGSATTTVRADGFTAHRITFANDWLRADHPDFSGTQAVALKVLGDRSAFRQCRFLGHQDTLYADSMSLAAFPRQYFGHCYVEGDVDFVFGRATAVFDGCHFHTLNRTDLAAAPYGFVFAPSTAVADPRGYLVTRSRVTSEAPDGYYKLARPWVPSSDPTARPSRTVFRGERAERRQSVLVVGRCRILWRESAGQGFGSGCDRRSELRCGRAGDETVLRGDGHAVLRAPEHETEGSVDAGERVCLGAASQKGAQAVQELHDRQVDHHALVRGVSRRLRRAEIAGDVDVSQVESAGSALAGANGELHGDHGV